MSLKRPWDDRLRSFGHFDRYIGAFLLVAAFVTIMTPAVSAQAVAVRGNHPAAMSGLTLHAATDRPLQLHIQFALRNRAALDKLLVELQDPTSPQYHRWLTSAQFESRFGRTPGEIAEVREWLRNQGFQITHESTRGIEMNGTIGQAENTFATEILTANDGSVYTNSSDPRIPAQFVGIIGSIEGLDNTLHWAPFGATPAGIEAATASAASILASVALTSETPWMGSTAIGSNPNYSGAYGVAFGPSDLWTFYDEASLLNSGINGGAGDCIAFVEDSDYPDNGMNSFISTFSLPAPTITRVFADGTSPGANGDALEALLDIEWGHAVATGAPIRVYIGNGGNALVDAISNAVADNKCGAISISYGFCGGSSSFYTSTLDSMFARAAAQGQSVFVSSGDEGAAGLVLNRLGNACVSGTSRNASEMAADPNVTAVGGTGFNPVYSSGADVGSVGEFIWNDQAGSGGGGQSKYFGKPSYQTAGTPSDGKRDIPDVANAASPYYPGFYWGDVDSQGNGITECCVGGTSLAAPLWAGLSKLIAQVSNGRLGNMNPQIYRLGALSNSSVSGLRDVTSGNNNYNGVTGFSAIAGYDLASGWGTADMATFVTAYTGASPTSTPSPTPISTPTSSPTPVSTLTPTPTSTPSPTPTPRPTSTPTPRRTPRPTPTPRRGRH